MKICSQCLKDCTEEFEVDGKFYCSKVCGNTAHYERICQSIQPFSSVVTRTYIFPKNHSKKIFCIASNFDRARDKGKLFINQFYPMSHYVEPSKNSEKDFTSENIMAEEHEKLMQHYLEVNNGTFNTP